MPSTRPVVVAFASGSEDLIPTFLGELARIAPEADLYVVAEFAPPHGRWIPWLLGRTLAQNRARVADALRGRRILWSALILQPRMPYWSMRTAALLAAPLRLLCFNECLNHFPLHPRAALSILRHVTWRMRNYVRWQFQPGGSLYTLLWRVLHPTSLRRPLLVAGARLAGYAAWCRKRTLPARPDPVCAPLPEGITVVIPSRDGAALLARLLPGLERELRGFNHEIIVSDNGSSDSTEAWLAREYPAVQVELSPQPLSFAAAVNRGIRRARFAHVCLLNNDMELEAGFFAPLVEAFRRVPGLFCATAQIFFPPGVRREETGKALAAADAGPTDFPIWCATPLDGEDHSYVLYGSGGCSLYDTAKLHAVGDFPETFTPAYVEDLDVGCRGWVRGWPTVFVAGARLVHHHRSTTRRFFTPDQIQRVVEINYLRHLARSVASPDLFFALWRRAIERLNLRATAHQPEPWLLPVLRAAWSAPAWVEPAPPAPADERLARALGSGDAVSFPGRADGGSKPVVLIASPYLPFPLSHGGAVRMYNLMRRSLNEYSLVLLAYCDPLETPAPEILELCAEVVVVRRQGSHLRPLTGRPDVVEEHDTAGFRAALRQLIGKHRPALVQLEFTQMALYARDCSPVPTVLVEHDITLDLYSQLERERPGWETARQLERWRTFERQAWREVSAVVTMSEKDAATVSGARHVAVLPNGVDLDRFRPCADPPEARRILFIGSFAHLPNLLALDFFLREAWPALRGAGATLHLITGNRAGYYQELYQDRVQVDLSQPGIEVEGFVSDVRPAYRRAEVVIAPLLASAGTNIKIMEAMAMGKAIVSTPAGINGLRLHLDEDVIVVHSGAAMVEAILALSADPARRARIERAARLCVEREFNWERIAERQSRLYRRLFSI